MIEHGSSLSIGFFHLLITSRWTRKSSFISAVSEVNEPLVLVTLRNCRWKASMELVVYKLTTRAPAPVDAPDHGAIVKHQTQIVPVSAPTLDHLRVALAPLLFQSIEGVLGLFPGGGLVDRFEISHEVFAVRMGQVLLRVADLMHDTELHIGLRLDRGDSIDKARQIVYRSDENVF